MTGAGLYGCQWAGDEWILDAISLRVRVASKEVAAIHCNCHRRFIPNWPHCSLSRREPLPDSALWVLFRGPMKILKTLQRRCKAMTQALELRLAPFLQQLALPTNFSYKKNYVSENSNNFILHFISLAFLTCSCIGKREWRNKIKSHYFNFKNHNHQKFAASQF